MRLAIYGAGEECRKYLEKKSNDDIQIVLIVDSDEKKVSSEICGYLISEVPALKKVKWDKILVTPYKIEVRSEIAEMLMNEYQVEDDKIVSVEELVTGRRIQLSRKIYDCFTFYNELDILEMRMKLLSPIVDYFVIVEMERTQRGEKKRFYFEENKERYTEYLHKVIHVKITDEMIPNKGKNLRTSLRGHVHDWTLEIFQRNCISIGVKDSKPEDIILISDLDEIPNPQVLEQIRSEAIYISCLPQLLEGGPIVLEKEMYMGYINCKAEQKWLGTVITLRKNMLMPDELRSFRGRYPQIERGGWHITWMGATREKILQKQRALCEGTESTEKEMEEMVTNIYLGRGMPTNDANAEIIPLDEITFPLAKELYEKEKEKWFI